MNDILNNNDTSNNTATKPTIAKRFRGYLPVVVDVETAGFNATTDGLLEIACVPILMNDDGVLYQGDALNAHLKPFDGANLEPSALEFTGIRLNSPLRQAIAEDEKTALKRIFKALKTVKNDNNCQKCILVGHNAHFDLAFLNSAIARTHTKNQSPFHTFSVLDTASLSALAFGHTVLARSCKIARIDFDNREAHSALYDTKKTAELFCHIFNHLPMLVSPEHQAQDNDI